MATTLTPEQFVEWYGTAELAALADRDGAGVDLEFFARRAREATTIVEEFIGPVADPLPDTLVGIAAALTRWHLHIHDKPGAVQLGYEAAMARLKAMRDGKTVIPPEILDDSLPEFDSRERELW